MLERVSVQESYEQTISDINAYYDSPAVALFEQLTQQQIHLGYWDDRYPYVSIEQAASRLTQVVLDYIQLPKGARILDIGCGCGAPALALARQKKLVVEGITINREQKRKADMAAKAAGLAASVSFSLTDGRHLTHSDEYFDGALLLESIHHIGHRTALEQVHRVLKPGAQLVIADAIITKDNAQHSSISQLSDIFVADSMVSAKTLSELLHQCGFILHDSINLTRAVQTTWSKLATATQVNRDELVNQHGGEFYDQLVAFWEQIRILWLANCKYLLIRASKA